MRRVALSQLLVLASACGRTTMDEPGETTGGGSIATSLHGSEAGEAEVDSSAGATTGTLGSDGGDASSGGDAPPPDVSSGCGDGIVDGAEECDDGNDVPADGCNPDCVPSGRLRWRVDLPGIDLSDWAVHERLAVSSAGLVAVAGPAAVAGAPARLFVLDPDGRLVADLAIDHGDDTRPRGVAYLPALAIVGDARHGNGPRMAWVEARDPTRFTVIATAVEHAPHGLSIDAFAPAPAGHFAWASAGDSATLELLDAEGTRAWSSVLPGAAIDTLGVDAITGDLVAGGDLPSAIRGETPDVARFTADGALVWTLDLGPLTTHAVVDRIAVTAAGEAVLLAGQFAPPSDQLGIVTLDRDGAILWRHESYELGSIDAAHELPSPRDVTVDASGDIVVAGWESRSEGGSDPWVLKLDPAGDVRWQAILPGPSVAESAYELGLMVATAPDGTIVLAGRRDTEAGDLAWVASLTP